MSERDTFSVMSDNMHTVLLWSSTPGPDIWDLIGYRRISVSRDHGDASIVYTRLVEIQWCTWSVCVVQ